MEKGNDAVKTDIDSMYSDNDQEICSPLEMSGIKNFHAATDESVSDQNLRIKQEIFDIKCEFDAKDNTNQAENLDNVISYHVNSFNYLDNNRESIESKSLFKCEICNYQCSYSSTLQWHMKYHNDEQSFICNICSICSYKCSNQGGLKLHMRTHSSEKPYACGVCNFKCSNNGALRLHMKIHTRKNPLIYGICKPKLAQNNSLKHMIRNNSEKLNIVQSATEGTGHILSYCNNDANNMTIWDTVTIEIREENIVSESEPLVEELCIEQ